MSKPRILVINDDRALIETRQMLLEDSGAIVFTARGSEEALRETLHEPADLVLIDATNVGLEQGKKLCGFVKALRPSECVATPAKIRCLRRVVSTAFTKLGSSQAFIVIQAFRPGFLSYA